MSSLNPDPEPRAIPPAIRRELQDELDLLLAQEPEPITTDRQEHAALRRLRAEAAAGGATPVHGEIQRFRPGQPIDYANEDVLDQTTRPVALAPRARLALMGAAALLIVGVLALNTAGAAPRARAPVAPAAAAPTAAPTVTPEPLGAIRIGGASLPPVYPNALGVGERQWAVTVAPVDKGGWRVAQAANTANWLPGSVVNWSFGLWDDAARSNAAVFARLGPDSTATLWLSSGAVRTFRLGAVESVPRPQITVLGQRAPGLTIALLGGDPGARRAVVRGVETDGAADALPGAGGSPAPR